MTLKHIKSVMVVDDDPQFIEHLTHILAGEGIRVNSASNCLDALLIVSDDIPDLFMIDRLMPTISGDRLCRILRSQPQLANSYRVMLSSIADDVKIDVDAMGAHACVAKTSGKMLETKVIKVLRRLDKSQERLDTMKGNDPETKKLP